VLAAVATVLAIPLLLGRATHGGAPLWLGAALLATLCAAGLVLVFHRGDEGLGLPASWRRGYATAAALGLTVAVWWAPSAPEGLAQHLGASASRGWAGAATGALRPVSDPGLLGTTPADPLARFGEHASAGLLFAAVVGALVLRGARNTTPVAPSLSGANAGIAAGLAAAAGLHLSLEGSSTLRLCVLALPVVLGMVVGSVTGRRALGP